MTETQMSQVSGVLKSFRLEFDELAIEPAIVENYIGFTSGMIPEPFPQVIAEMLAETGKRIKPLGGYALFDNINVDQVSKRITIGDITFHTHAVVTKKLDRSQLFALFACTAGEEITRMASEYNNDGHAVYAYIVDSLGSMIVERAMDIIRERLKSDMNNRGLQITNGYSPGYCDWDIREQKKLFGLLPVDFCGIRLSDSMLMQPIKSVSGIIGIGEDVTYDQHNCKYCKDVNCLYRGRRI